jgi:predicted RNA-binding protein with PIN domain
MSLVYIIDGYNLINHQEFRRKCKKTGDDRAALLAFISRNKLTGSWNNKIIVVFDGYPQEESANFNSEAEVIFSRNESADEKIKKIIEKSNNTKNIIAVSDDKEIKFIVKSLGARAMGVAEFINAKKRIRRPKDDSAELELTYTQIHKINQELSKIWLK